MWGKGVKETLEKNTEVFGTCCEKIGTFSEKYAIIYNSVLYPKEFYINGNF